MKRINQIEPCYGKEERAAVNKYMTEGGWLSEFKKTEEFERMVAEYTGAKHCSVVSSGTIALQVALMALGIGEGHKVIVPDYTMVATAYAVSLVGAEVVLIDIELDNLGIGWEVIAGAHCIMPVCINGRVADDYGEMVSVARDTSGYWGSFMPVIEDACQAVGSRCNSRHLGTFGDIGVLSFNAFKIISTGQGGALLTNNDELHDKIERIKDFGRLGGRGAEYEILGMNAKFSDLLAVVGIEQMKKLNDRVSKKKLMYAWYMEMLMGVEQVKFPETNLDDCAPWYMDILCEDRDGLMAYLGEQNIGTQPFYPPLHRLNEYKHGLVTDAMFPNSIYVSEHGLWLPSSVFLEQSDIEHVCGKIRGFYNG